jgi:hypothetical protein
MILLLAACAGPAEPEMKLDTLALTDEANAHTDTTLTFAPVPVAARTDVAIDWSALTRTVHGDPLEPAAITRAELDAFPDLDPEGLASAFVRGDVVNSDISVHAVWENPTGATGLPLSSLVFLGHPLDAAELTSEAGTWLLRLGTPDDADAHVVVLDPRDDGDPRAALADADAAFTVETTFGAGMDASETADWTGLTKDTEGCPFSGLAVQELAIGWFDGDLPSDAATLARSASAWYTLDVYGDTRAKLSEADGADGTFPGFDGDGRWILRLACADCSFSPPIFLAEVTPR